MKLLMYGLNIDEHPEQEKSFYNLTECSQHEVVNYIQNISGVVESFVFQNTHTFEVFLFVDEDNFQHGDLLRYFAEWGQLDLKDVIYHSIVTLMKKPSTTFIKRTLGQSG